VNLIQTRLRHLQPWSVLLLLSLCIVLATGTLGLVLLYWQPQTVTAMPWPFWLSIAADVLVISGLVFALIVIYRNRVMLNSLESNFREFMNVAADMMLISDVEGRIIDASRRSCELLGYDLDDLLHKTLWDIDVECYLRRHPKLRLDMERGHTITYETFYRKMDGSRLPVESRVRKAYWMDRAVYIEIARDITSRKLAEDALLESKAAVERARNLLESRMVERTEELHKRIEERNQAQRRAQELSAMLEDMIDCMPSVIITVDSSRRVRHWNQQAVALTSISAQQASGKFLKTLLPQFDQQIEAVTEATSYGRRQHAARVHARLNERAYLFDVVVYPLSGRGKGVVIRVDDVTEKVRIEQTLVQTEKMLSLGGLAAGMAHEINNPLGAILQSTQNIERRLSPDWPRNISVAEHYQLNMESLRNYLDKQRIPEFLSGIREAGERAAAIVADMLSFARQSSTELVPIDLVAALEASVRLAGADYNQNNQFEFRRVSIVRDYDNELPRVRAQKNQLEQVFLNLLLNAAHALATQNNADPTIHLHLFRQEDHAVVEIRDNGPGMEEAVRRRVFEPFFTTKEEGHGTGLGLSVSYFIITEQLKGAIDVESVAGEGTTFRIRLPFSDKHAGLPVSTRAQIELPL
jgi:PAS domain S-box-containing protein